MKNKWDNGPDFEHSVGAVMLIDADGNIIGQYRDGKAPKNANLVGIFGGRLEADDATAVDGAARELREETNRPVPSGELEPFMTYNFNNGGTPERLHVFVSRGHTTDGLEVYEGRGHYVITDPNDPLLAPIIKPAVDAWFGQKNK